MANPQNLKSWKKGIAPNPRGYSQKRRIADSIKKLIDENGLDKTVALTLIAMATGNKKLITDSDGTVRTPDLDWMKELLDRVDGTKIEHHKHEFRDMSNEDLAGEIFAEASGIDGGSLSAGDDDNSPADDSGKAS
jgi:hypothetical protein